LSQQPPADPFVAPPPPVVGNPMYPPLMLERKAEEVREDSRNALIMSIFGLVCFGFVLGYFALRKANSALDTITLYQVAHERRGIAMTAKVLAIVDIVGWIAGLILRFALS